MLRFSRRPLFTALLLGSAALPLTGCLGVWRGTARSYDLAPNGLSRPDDALRRALVSGSFADVQSRLGLSAADVKHTYAPDDELLRALYQGTASYYAGEYAQSIRAFADADALTERRYTKSVSKSGLSLISNDMALPYVPSRTERLFIRYYAMMAHVRSGDMNGATVEARRLGRLLEDQSETMEEAERTVHAVMRDAAGAVFESVGETNDALVSYRNAAVLRGVPMADVDTMTLQTPAGDSATVVLVVESGFVAYRVDRGITIPVGDGVGDNESLTEQWLLSLPNGGVYDDDLNSDWQHTRRHVRSRTSVATKWLRLSWPALRRSPMPTAHVSLAIDSLEYHLTGPTGDVSDAVAQDLRRARPALVTRMIARAGAKAAAAEAFDGDKEWVGSILSAVGTGLERADVRSWQLLPGTIRTVRITVPAGSYHPVLHVGEALGRVPVRLSSVQLAPRSVTVMDTRVWRDAAAMVANTP